jgi:hypothetical protein
MTFFGCKRPRKENPRFAVADNAEKFNFAFDEIGGASTPSGETFAATIKPNDLRAWERSSSEVKMMRRHRAGRDIQPRASRAIFKMLEWKRFLKPRIEHTVKTRSTEWKTGVTSPGSEAKYCQIPRSPDHNRRLVFAATATDEYR